MPLKHPNFDHHVWHFLHNHNTYMSSQFLHIDQAKTRYFDVILTTIFKPVLFTISTAVPKGVIFITNQFIFTTCTWSTDTNPSFFHIDLELRPFHHLDSNNKVQISITLGTNTKLIFSPLWPSSRHWIDSPRLHFLSAMTTNSICAFFTALTTTTKLGHF